MSPLDLGDVHQQGAAGDAKEDDLQKGWKAIWKRVQAHKDRQALERKAAKKVGSVTSRTENIAGEGGGSPYLSSQRIET